MKFISSSYNKETGHSEVVIQNRGKKFIGAAQTHPEEEFPSKYFGCEYAEIRAEIAALKYEYKFEKQKVDEIKKFINACKCYNKYNAEDDTAKVIHKQLNKRIDRVNDLAELINKRYKELDILLKKREVVLKALKRKKRTKEDNNN